MTDNSDNKGKYYRILGLWQSLNQGRVIYKEEQANLYGVSKKTIQRDLDDIRSFLANQFEVGEIIYDPTERGYYLREPGKQRVSGDNIIVVCKILSESKNLTRDDIAIACKILSETQSLTEKEMSIVVEKIRRLSNVQDNA